MDFLKKNVKWVIIILNLILLGFGKAVERYLKVGKTY